jgi:hypothetical protein
MKTKRTINPKQKKPVHLHIEHISRWRLCLLVASGLLLGAILRGDQNLLATAGEAYMEESGQFNSHVREERNHAQATLHVLRVPTVSGR